MPAFEIIGQIDLSDAKKIFEQFARPTWAEVKWIFEFSVYLLACIAALGVLWRLRKIIDLVRAINDGRSPIWDLRQTADSLRSTVEEMRKARAEMASLLAEIDFKDSLKALQTQLADIQRVSADDSVLASQSIAVEDPSARANWEEIRNIWTDARNKLEKIIDNEDGRKTRKYAQMNRRDYTSIIENLLSDGLIDRTIARNAIYMNDTYLSFRNQRNVITEDLKSEFNQRKRSFDNAIANFKPSAPPAAPITIPFPSPSLAPKSAANGRTQSHDPSLR
jgi:hypothetical protein